MLKAKHQHSSNFQTFKFSAEKQLIARLSVFAHYVVIIYVYMCITIVYYLAPITTIMKICRTVSDTLKNCRAFHRFMIKSLREEYISFLFFLWSDMNG